MDENNPILNAPLMKTRSIYIPPAGDVNLDNSYCETRLTNLIDKDYTTYRVCEPSLTTLLSSIQNLTIGLDNIKKN